MLRSLSLFVLLSFATHSLATVVGLESEVYATSEFGITHRLYVTFDGPTDELVAIYGTVGANENSPLSILSSAPIFNSALGTNFGEGINPLFFSSFPEVEYDSWLTIGSADNSGSGGVNSVGMETYLSQFNAGD